MKALIYPTILIFSLSLFLQLGLSAQEVYVGGSEEDDYGTYGDYDPREHGATEFDPNDDGLPIVYSGDGMTVTIRKIDDYSGVLSGDLTLNNGRPMSLQVQIQVDRNGYEVGIGQVNTPSGPKQIRSRDESEDVILASFDGRNYRLRYQEAGQQYQQRDYGEQQRQEQPEYREQPPRPEQQGNTPKPTSNVVMTSHTLRDRALNNMPSQTLLAPKGWKVEGGGWWPPSQAPMWTPSYDIKVTGPDGSMVHFEPMIEAQEKTGWGAPAEGTVADGFPVMKMPRDINEWSDYLTRQHIPGTYKGASDIRVIKANVVPFLTDIARKNMEKQQQGQPQIPQGGGMRTYRDARVMHVDVAFTHNGKRWHQRHLFTHEYHALENQMTGEGQKFWSTHGGMVFRAPDGQLESRMPLMMSIVHSFRAEKPWLLNVMRHQAKIRGIFREISIDAINATAQRAGIVSNTLSAINDMGVAGYKQRESIRDAGQRRIVNGILDTEDYVDPSSGSTVSLSNQYDHVFSNGNGDYILSNDVSYDPGKDQNQNGNWQRMQVSR